MLLKNHTSVADDYLLQILSDCLTAYHDLYEPASSEVEFILFDSPDKLKEIRAILTNEDDGVDYDGNFVAPRERTDTLTILALLKEKNIRGAEQYFTEKENGSLRDTVDDQARAARGEKLMAFFEFAEMIQHEYSHLCSYERLMTATDWADPLFLGHDWNYHLHDEFIARYRGTRAMLHMAEPYAEKNLLYSLWMGYWDDLNKEFKEHIEDVRTFLADRAKGIETETLMFMKQNGLSSSDMIAELEHELGHPLHLKGELSASGVPKLTPIEVVEFLTFEDTEKRTIPLMYAIRNPYASYHGAQLLGLIQAFHDHFSLHTGNSDGLELPESGLDLTAVMATPFYEYVDVAKAKETLERFIETFTKMAETPAAKE
ncbi:MAG: hypothetical protein IJ100_06580 [Lachnospiraceae bacterium]|nr:hypothetical protein [Lachnospiraceae bacterium]